MKGFRELLTHLIDFVVKTKTEYLDFGDIEVAKVSRKDEEYTDAKGTTFILEEIVEYGHSVAKKQKTRTVFGKVVLVSKPYDVVLKSLFCTTKVVGYKVGGTIVDTRKLKATYVRARDVAYDFSQCRDVLILYDRDNMGYEALIDTYIRHIKLNAPQFVESVIARTKI